MNKYNVIRRLSYIHHFSPSTKPGFIRSDNFQKLSSALKLLDIKSPNSQIPPLQNQKNGSHVSDLTVFNLPSKTELASIKIFPKSFI